MFLIKVGLLSSPILFTEFFMEKFDHFSTKKSVFRDQNLEMFEEVIHNFGKSDGDII